jgi:hypothetical protein
VSQLRGRVFDRATGRLCREAGKAADVLASLLDSEDEGVRHRAAKTILETASRLRDAGELERRLLDLETWAEEARKKGARS